MHKWQKIGIGWVILMCKEKRKRVKKELAGLNQCVMHTYNDRPQTLFTHSTLVYTNVPDSIDVRCCLHSTTSMGLTHVINIFRVRDQLCGFHFPSSTLTKKNVIYVLFNLYLVLHVFSACAHINHSSCQSVQ